MGEQIRKKARGRQPISRHPLFPATVALWFAALFGLGSLIIRPALLEALVLAVGLDAIIPAAAPPLGATARMLLALAMAALGGIVGLVAAYRIPRASYGARRGAESSDGESAAENPLWSDLKTRRRAIAAGQEAPLPEAGTRPEAEELAETEDLAETEAYPRPTIDVPPQVLDLAAVDAEALAPAPAAPEAEPEIAELEIAEPFADTVADTAPDAVADFVPDSLPDSLAHAAADAAADAATSALPPERPRTEVKPAPAPLFAAPLRPAAGDAGFPLPSSTAAERIASAELSELSHVELLERLALSLERRRHAPGPAPALAPTLAAAPVAAAAAATAPAPRAPEIAPEIAPGLAAEAKPAPEPAPLPEPHPAAAPFAAVPLAALQPPLEQPPLEQRPVERPAAAPAELPRFMSALVAPAGPDAGDAEDDSDDEAVFLPRFLPAPAAIAPREDLTPDEAHWPAAREAQPEPEAEYDFSNDAGSEHASDAAAEHAFDEDDGSGQSAHLAEEDEAEEEDDEQVLENGYSSLLSLGRNAAPRQFIRIDEADTDAGVVEPAVIFPGQGPVAAAASTGRFDAPSASAALRASGQAAPVPSRRPFDAPGEPAPGATPTFASTRPQGPEETERALREALAALQRMSGAA